MAACERSSVSWVGSQSKLSAEQTSWQLAPADSASRQPGNPEQGSARIAFFLDKVIANSKLRPFAAIDTYQVQRPLLLECSWGVGSSCRTCISKDVACKAMCGEILTVSACFTANSLTTSAPHQLPMRHTC